MSDSDDDGFFEAMAKVGTRTSKRKENKTTEERLAMLESAIAMEDKNRQLQGRLLKMKQEEPSDDRVKQAEEQLILAATTTAQRRQETYNTIHGIHDLDDGLTDCKRMALSNAVDTDKSSLLGTRKTLQCCVEPKELYRTNQEAVKALVAILKSKELKNHVIGKKMLALSSNVHNLSIFLSKPHALMVAMNQHRTPHLPHHLCQWLFFMACSRNCNVMQLSRAAFKCLEHIWKNTMEPAEDPFLVLNDLESQLRSWFGLKITVWDVHNKYQGETDGDEIIKSTTWSLRRWLTLWGILFQNGLVTGTETLKETATRCVVALVQVGLDPVVVHNPGQGLLRELQCTLQELVNLVALSIEENEWKEWIQTASSEILAPLLLLGPGSPDSEDSDDEGSFLCISLAVRLFPIHDSSGRIPIPITEFKEALSAHALRLCTGIDRWNDATLPQIISKETLNFVSIEQLSMDRWRALMTSCAAFFLIEQAGESISMDGPRILATVEVVMQELLVGLRLFGLLKSMEGSGIYGSKEEAGQVGQLLHIIDEQCTSLSKQMGRLSSQAHFRRAECYLINLRGYCRQVKDEAIRIAGTAVSKKVQGSLTKFWRSSRGDSDNEESQEYQSLRQGELSFPVKADIE